MRQVLLVLVAFLAAVAASAKTPADIGTLRLVSWIETNRDKLSDFWYLPKGEKTKINFLLSADGEVLRPEVIHSSGHPDFDITCLELVSCMPPIRNLQPGILTEENRAVLTFSESYLKVSQRLANDELEKRKKLLIIHSIPLSVLVQYPGLFKMSELTGRENLLVIGKLTDSKRDNRVQLQRAKSVVDKHAKRWYRFYKRHSSTTKEEVFMFAEKTQRQLQCKRYKY